MRKMKPYKDEEIESYNNQKFYYICIRKSVDVDDRDNIGDNDINQGDYDNVFELRKIASEVLEPDIKLDDCDDTDNDDDNEFNGIKVHGISKKYERVHDHCRYTGNYRGLQTISVI